MRLQGRTALITGAAEGIGQGMAQRFATEGARVMIADFNTEKGAAVARAIVDAGGTAAFVACDVTDRAQVLNAVDKTVDAFGAIDILVNNAYRGRGLNRVEATSDDDFSDGLATCFWAIKWAMDAAFPHMRNSGWGRIINIGSLNGVNAHIGTAPYNVGKEAMRALTRTAAREWAKHGICANILCPAAVSASFLQFQKHAPEVSAQIEAANPMGRIGDPLRDIAGVALFLASEDARYLTGNTLFVDGGAHINGVAWTPALPDEPATAAG